MFEKVISKWGTLDILVNNVGTVMEPDCKEYEELHNIAGLKKVDEVMKNGKMPESVKTTSSFQDEW